MLHCVNIDELDILRNNWAYRTTERCFDGILNTRCVG
jgi:hypothetical protein